MGRENAHPCSSSPHPPPASATDKGAGVGAAASIAAAAPAAAAAAACRGGSSTTRAPRQRQPGARRMVGEGAPAVCCVVWSGVAWCCGPAHACACIMMVSGASSSRRAHTSRAPLPRPPTGRTAALGRPMHGPKTNPLQPLGSVEGGRGPAACMRAPNTPRQRQQPEHALRAEAAAGKRTHAGTTRIAAPT